MTACTILPFYPDRCFLHSRHQRTRSSDGIVFDPTQSAHAVQQIEQGESQLQKLSTELNNWQQHLLKEAQIYTSLEQTRNQIVTMYNLAYQMSPLPQNLAARYKRRLGAVDEPGCAAEHLRQYLRVGERAQLRRTHPGAAGLQRAPIVQAQSYPSGELFLSRPPGPRPPSPTSTRPRSWHKRPQPIPSATLGTIRSNEQAFATKLSNLDSDTFSTDSRPADTECLARQNQLRHTTPDSLPAGHQPVPRRLDRSSSSSRRSSRSTRRTAPSTTPFTSSRTFPPPCRTSPTA